MKDINKVILSGRLGADPVRRETKSGASVAYFPLATSRRVAKEGGGRAAEADGTSESDGASEIAEVTEWHRVTVWGRTADFAVKHLKKGYSTFVEGAIRTHKYENKEGEEKTSFEIHASSVSLLGKPLRVVRSEAGAPQAEEEEAESEESAADSERGGSASVGGRGGSARAVNE